MPKAWYSFASLQDLSIATLTTSGNVSVGGNLSVTGTTTETLSETLYGDMILGDADDKGGKIQAYKDASGNLGVDYDPDTSFWIDVTLDVNGNKIVLDADADTSITADTDDQIDIEIAGADDFKITANTFTALSGSTIKANTIAETTAASGVTIDSAVLKDGGATFSGAVTITGADADRLILGGASAEGGDIKVYKDASGGLSFELDADAPRLKVLDAASAGRFDFQLISSDAAVLGYDASNNLRVQLVARINADTLRIGDTNKEGGDISVYTDASGNKSFFLDADTGQLALPVSGSGAGILLGGDALLYRVGADILETPDQLRIGAELTVLANIYLGTLGAADVQLSRSAADVLTLASGDKLQLLTPNAVALELGHATAEGGDINIYTDGAGNLAFTLDADTGQLTLPVSGSGAGLLLGGDALLYRVSANLLRTPDGLTVDGVLTASGGMALAGTLDMNGNAILGVAEIKSEFDATDYLDWVADDQFDVIIDSGAVASFQDDQISLSQKITSAQGSNTLGSTTFSGNVTVNADLLMGDNAMQNMLNIIGSNNQDLTISSETGTPTGKDIKLQTYDVDAVGWVAVLTIKGEPTGAGVDPYVLLGGRIDMANYDIVNMNAILSRYDAGDILQFVADDQFDVIIDSGAVASFQDDQVVFSQPPILAAGIDIGLSDSTSEIGDTTNHIRRLYAIEVLSQIVNDALYINGGRTNANTGIAMQLGTKNAADNIIARLQITGGINTAVATWSAVTHTGLNIGANLLKTTNLAIKENDSDLFALRDAGDTTAKGILLNAVAVTDAGQIRAANSDASTLIFQGRDTGVGLVEVARIGGAADPYFSMGGSQEFKFYNSGTADFGGKIKVAEYIEHLGDSNTYIQYQADTILTYTGGNERIRADTTGVGFFGTSQAKQAHIVDADGTLADITTKFNQLLADLEGYGLLASA